jgi:hypothetical protein
MPLDVFSSISVMVPVPVVKNPVTEPEVNDADHVNVVPVTSAIGT